MDKGRLMMFYRLLILVFFYSFCCTPADSRVIQKRAAFYIANETMCIVDGHVYRNGDPVPTDDECERCTCRPPGFSCVLRDCDTKPGCKAVRKVGECCPEYVCGCVHNNRLYEDGELIKDLQNNCYTCRCHGSSISCIFADCHFRGDCQPEYVQGECCPRYDHCPPISTTTTTTTRATPPPDQVQQEIDFVNFTTQHLQKFTDEDTTITVQDVLSSDSGFTTPAYEISKETLLTVKFTLSSEKLSSIHDFDVFELTTLLPLQSVTYKEVTRDIIPPLHTELTTLKDGLIAEESDKITIEQLGVQTEVAVEVTTSGFELDSSKEAVSDTNVGGSEITKDEADDIKSSVTKGGIFAPIGFEESTESTTDSQLKTTEVIEISTFHKDEFSTFASGSKISTIKQEDQTESLQPVFVTIVTSEKQDTSTHQPTSDNFTPLNISDITLTEFHTDSEATSTKDSHASSTEYSLSVTSNTSSSDSTSVIENTSVTDIDDSIITEDLQNLDSVHDDLQTSDSTHDDVSTSVAQTSDLENENLHASTQEYLAFSTATSDSTKPHSHDLHTDDKESFGITYVSSQEQTTAKLDILHSTSNDSQEFDSEHETEISTSDESDLTTHENLSPISESNESATADDNKIEAGASTETTKLQTTDDNTVTFGSTGQDIESSVHHEYTDSEVSKSTYDYIITSTEISDLTHTSESHESSDDSVIADHDDEDLKSSETTGVTDYGFDATSTDHDLSITSANSEEDLEELDSSEHDVSTVLHETEFTTTSAPTPETNENIHEDNSTHTESVISAERESVNESSSQEIITESVSLVGSTLEDEESSFNHTGSSYLTKLPSNDNMDILDLTEVSPSTIYTELDLTTDVVHSTSFKHELTDLESDTESVSITQESAFTSIKDLPSPSIYTEEKLETEYTSDSKKETTTEFVPYLSTENNTNQTTYDSITIVKDNTADAETNNIETGGATTVEQSSESDNVVAETSEISTYTERDSDVSGVFLSETDNEERVKTSEDYTTTNSEISIDLTSTIHDISESEVNTKENVDTFSSSPPEELQTSKTSSDVVEVTGDEFDSKQDETIPIQDDILSSKQPYTVKDHITSSVEDDLDSKLPVSIADKPEKGTTETNLDITLETRMTTLTVLQSTTDESNSEEVKESDILQVKHDTEHLSAHKEESTQSSESIQTTISKHTIEKTSPTPDNGMPSEIPGFEPPLANIFKQPMLFHRPTPTKESDPILITLDSSQNTSSNYSDENDVVRLSLTLAEDDREENGTQHISLIGNAPESDENNVFVLNHEYTIPDSEVNDIDFFDAEEIDLTSEETVDDVHTAGDEESIISSTLHNLPTANVPELEISTGESSTKIDAVNLIFNHDNDDIKTTHSSEEQTDSIKTEAEIANNTNILQFNSLPAISEGLDKTDSSLDSIHNIDNNLISNFESVNQTGDSQTSESVNNDEVLNTVSAVYISTKSAELSPVEHTETTTINFNTAELVSSQNSDFISLENNENNESVDSEITQHISTLNDNNQDLEGTTKEKSIFSTTEETNVNNIQKTSDKDNASHEDSTEKHRDTSESINEELTSEFLDVSTDESDSDTSQDIYSPTSSSFSHQDTESVDNTDHTEQEIDTHTSAAEHNSVIHPDLLTALHDISSTLNTNYETSETFNETVKDHEENYSEHSTAEDNGLIHASTIKVNILFGQNFFDSSKAHDIATTTVMEKSGITTNDPVHFSTENKDSITSSDSETANESSISFEEVKFNESEPDKNTDLKEIKEEEITSHSPITDDKAVEYQEGEVEDDSLTDIDSDSNSQEIVHTSASESAIENTDSSFSREYVTAGNDINTVSENKATLENTSSTDLINNMEESSSPFTILEYIGDLFSKFSTLSDINAESTFNHDITPANDEDLITTEHDSQTSESSINNSSVTNAYNSLLKNPFSQYGYLGGVYITGNSKYNGSSKEHSEVQNNDALDERLTADSQVSTQSSEPVKVTSSKSTIEKTSFSPENDIPTDTPNFEPPLAHIFKHPMFTKNKTTNKEDNLNLHQVDGSLSSASNASSRDSETSTVNSIESLDSSHHNSDSEMEVGSEEYHSEKETELSESTSADATSIFTTTNEELKSENSENVEIFNSETILNTENIDEHHKNTANSFASTISSESHNTGTDTYVVSTNTDANKGISEEITVPTSTLATIEETSNNEVIEISSSINDNNSVVNTEKGPEKEGEYFEPTEPHFPLANSVSDEGKLYSTSNTNSEAQTTVIPENHHESEETGDVLEASTATSLTSGVDFETKSTTSNYVDSSTIVEISVDESSTLTKNNDESLSTTASSITELSISDVTEIKYDSALISKNVPPLPILLKNMNEGKVRTHISESLPLEVDETNVNDSKNENTSLPETDHNGDDETSTHFGYGRNHVHPLHLTDVISQVFKAPGYDSEFRSNLYKGFAPLRKARESRSKRDAKDFTWNIQPAGSGRGSDDSSIGNDPTSVADGEDYSIKNKNILLVEGFGQKPSGFFPVTSSLIIVQSDEETEENEYKKNAKRKETVVHSEGDASKDEFLDVDPFGSLSKVENPSDLKKTHSGK